MFMLVRVGVVGEIVGAMQRVACAWTHSNGRRLVLPASTRFRGQPD